MNHIYESLYMIYMNHLLQKMIHIYPYSISYILHPAHTQYHCGKSPTRVPATKKQTTTNKYKEIEDLRNQIKLLKQNQRQRNTQEKRKHTENKEEDPEPKNIQVAPASGDHTQTKN